MNIEANPKKIAPAQTVKKHTRHEHPKVSVIVPVYKVDKYLTQCLNSIVNQTMEELEIIIVDEGDHDRCREIIDFFEKNDPRIVAPHQKNGGYGASCNLGINMARGEYIAIVESDDYIEPEMYEEMYDYAKALDADVVKTPFREVTHAGIQDSSLRSFYKQNLPNNTLFSATDFNSVLRFHGAIWAAIYRTAYIREKNIFFIEERGGGYVDIVFRFDTLTQTERIAWLDRAYYNYNVADIAGCQHNNHNVKAFMRRWSEIHTRINKLPKRSQLSIAPVLLYDEIGDTLAKIKYIPFTEEELELLHSNLSQVSDTTIESALNLSTLPLQKAQKEDIGIFIRNPKTFYRKYHIRRIFHIIPSNVKCFAKKFGSTTTLIWLVMWLIVLALIKYYSQISLDLCFCLFISGIILCFLVKLLSFIYIKVKARIIQGR